MEHLSRLRPFVVASDVLDPVPTGEGVERLAVARSKETQPPGPRIEYLETAAQSYALADGVSDAVWDDAVSWALDNPESFKRVLETSYRAWVAGDFEEVDRISTREIDSRQSRTRSSPRGITSGFQPFAISCNQPASPRLSSWAQPTSEAWTACCRSLLPVD